MDLQLLPNIQRTLNLPPIQNIHEQLPKSHSKPPWPTRSMEEITEIVVHHSGDTASIENEAKFHINQRGWYTISYHVSIDRGGIYQLNDLLSRTSHAKGANGNSIGVCINWNLTLRPPTDFEYKALIGVILSLKSIFPNAAISGHYEVGKRNGYGTQCPVISMDKLRKDVMDMEQELAYNEAPQKKEEVAYRIANQTLYFYNMAKGKGPTGEAVTDGQKQWAMNKLLELEPEFRRLGYLK